MKLPLVCLATAILVTESAQAGDLLDFPIPDSPVVIPAQSESGGTSIADLIALYSEATGQHCVMDSETQGYANVTLVSSQPGKAMTIAPERFQVTFETLLIANDFVFTPLTADEPRLFSITSLNTDRRFIIKTFAMYLPADRLDEAAAHPAILFTTVITVPNTDVRQVTTALRMMFPDPNTQQMLPAGNTHAVVLMGLGPKVASLAQLLAVVDESAGSDSAVPDAEEKEAAESTSTSQACDVSGSQAVRVAGA
jgi:type II secretory pathway component GspD/PulD (secretin)